MSQTTENPFLYSDTNKRYHTYDYHMKKHFGGKCAKLPLDAGFTCPNIDGGCSTGGCIYCSSRGSGDFAPEPLLSIGEQIRRQRERYARKWDTSRCIAYFQAHTNTYAPTTVLREKFESALCEEGIVGLHVATRADCLPEETVEYLAQLSERTYLCVELGLQSSSDETATLINRGHTYAQFLDGYERLRRASDRIRICVHIILGLPGEDDERMLRTVRDVAALRPDEVKLHLLHVLRGTPLAKMYEEGKYVPLERTHYIRLVADALELLPPETVIARLTGDGMGEELLAPLWSLKKTTVINDVDKLLFSRNSYQGKRFEK
ncbi:MAG: TIGR01212 family radical SAM protein [Ruminococcaceae bacterium]|nr:TIGR01212 family radical SAM protein [Oscillospiraceae bacterium]